MAHETATDLKKLLDPRRRDERLARLTPEQRELYDRITRWRAEFGRVDFNINEALRDLRESA